MGNEKRSSGQKARVSRRHMVPARDWDPDQPEPGGLGVGGAARGRVAGGVLGRPGLAGRPTSTGAMGFSMGSLRPTGVGGILDRAVLLFRHHFGPLVFLSFLLWLAMSFGVRLLLESSMAPSLEQSLFASLGVMFSRYPLETLVIAIASMLVAREQGSSHGGRSFLGVLFLAFLMGLQPFFLGCCVLPGLVFSWLLAVAAPAYLLDPPGLYAHGRVRLLEAIGRSARLAWGWGNFWRWMAILLVRYGIVFYVRAAIDQINSPAIVATIQESLHLDGLLLHLFLSVATSLFAAIPAAFYAMTCVAFYFDLRTRKESLDLERRLEGLARSSGAPIQAGLA